ncbi:hypothetical protein ACROYT_G028732 [Oculina patagonica]
MLELLEHNLVESFNEAYETNELSISQRRGIITLIPKEDGSLLDLSNWRPITVLNVDCKIASKAIAKRIEASLSKLVNSDQNGFIKGRYIGENIRLIIDIMEYTEKHNIPGILVSLDFRKAFDSLEWTFIMRTLGVFNFGKRSSSSGATSEEESDKDRKQPEVVSSRKRKLENAQRRDQGKLVERQVQDQFLAVLGKGEYQLIDKYWHLEVGDNYYRMTTSQKEALRKAFFTCRRVESNILQEAVDRENTELASPPALSVQPENSMILTVPYSVLTELFADAGHILDFQRSLVQAPKLTQESGKEELFFVASKEDPSKP